jgi:hypothetical protein
MSRSSHGSRRGAWLGLTAMARVAAVPPPARDAGVFDSYRVTLESIQQLPDWHQREIVAMASRMGFDLGSEREPGEWRCELGGYFWRVKL